MYACVHALRIGMLWSSVLSEYGCSRMSGICLSVCLSVCLPLPPSVALSLSGPLGPQAPMVKYKPEVSVIIPSDDTGC